MPLNFVNLRGLLRDFNFKDLFVEELGWSQATVKRSKPFAVKGEEFKRAQIAELSGAVVFEVESPSGTIPDAKTRAAVHKEIAAQHHENILVFVDHNRSQSLWHWGKRDGTKVSPREHLFFRGQPGDLFVSKLGQMCFDLSEFDDKGNVSIVEVAKRIQDALDVEPVTKKFYKEYDELRLAFVELIEGVPDDQQRRWYASVLLNRLMFIWFLQRKGFIDGGNLSYLVEKLDASKANGKDRYFGEFLKVLFFEGFAKPKNERSADARQLLGDIRYLNGGLFLPHTVEQHNPKLHVPDKAFDNLFSLFKRYSWNLNDSPGGEDDELNPDVLGYIFEKYINQKAFGAYYTRPEITDYLCERTIHQLILDAVDKAYPGKFTDIGDLLMNLDALLCKRLLFDVLPKLSLLDPACGSGAFLVAAMKVLIGIYSAVLGRIPFIKSGELKIELEKIQHEHKSTSYFIKKRIITDNLYGVDIMEEATEIARLRLFLALVAAADDVDQLEPLPNIDFNILPGNSLIGLLHVDADRFDAQVAPRLTSGKTKLPPDQAKFQLVAEGGKHDLPGMTYESGGPTLQDLAAKHVRTLQTRKLAQILEEKNRLIDTYRHAATYGKDLTALRDNIAAQKRASYDILDKLLLDEFQVLGIKYEQATWDNSKKAAGKTQKRDLALEDIRALRPFHWGFEFDEILVKRGGFDAIITNPPWEILKPNAKEFFLEYSDLISKKNMTIHDFEKQQTKLLKDPEIREAWLKYLSEYPYQSAYFRGAGQYKNQISLVNGKKAGSDTNLYKLFTEQCHNLLRNGGRCGIIVPSGIYTDLGAKQLREMLFSKSRIDSMIGLSNERFIFENVHHAFKFCLLSFAKDGVTDVFRVAFRINPREAISSDKLESFLHAYPEHLVLTVDIVKRCSPDSFSIMEFKNDADVVIAEKLLRLPPLGSELLNRWKVQFATEFHMTNDSGLYRTSPAPQRLPLWEGKMFHQFTSSWGTPKYWLDEAEARHSILGKEKDVGQKLDYQQFRLAFRDVTSSSNERTMIATVLPPGRFCPHTVSLESVKNSQMSGEERLYLVGVLNSFVVDSILRRQVSSHLSFYFLYSLPLPRLNQTDSMFTPIVERTARLICTTPEFDDLAKKVGLGSHKIGATDAAERARLRAELDGLVAHLYGLTEEEFAYILTTFPLVEQGVKAASLEAYRAFAPKTEDEEAAAIASAGENARVEFKSTARWDLYQSKPNKDLERVVVEEAAAFLNADGGTLLIGVADDGAPLGLDKDYQVFTKRKDRDAYENWLVQMLLNGIGNDLTPCLRVTFPHVNGVEICRVDIAPSPRPVYLSTGNEEHLYLRTGNSKKRLTAKETVEYVKQRWG